MYCPLWGISRRGVTLPSHSRGMWIGDYCPKWWGGGEDDFEGVEVWVPCKGIRRTSEGDTFKAALHSNRP